MSPRMVHSTDTSNEEVVQETDVLKPLTMSTTGWSDIGAYEDWFGSEVMIPRDTDRILEQIVLMLLRIGAYLKKEGIESIIDSQILNSAVPASWHQRENIDCTAMNADDTDTPPLVGSSKGKTASYLREYPQIFMKKQTDITQTECKIATLKTVHSHVETEDGNTSKNRTRRATPDASTENITLEVEKAANKKKLTISDNKITQEGTAEKLTTLSAQLKMKQNDIANEAKEQQQNQNSEFPAKNDVSEITNEVKNDLQESNLYNVVENEDSTDLISYCVSNQLNCEEHNCDETETDEIKNRPSNVSLNKKD